ncbi:3' terminal RNA ribose 2'-O-methyltransferase Hen1 [Herbidospora cretacea]|uniref:3' terminal RNA ribose 2'-O-methyltransferase Hen1 n=1 Tax=Herbidospora cretacea TaxID=28444 RepID=UPI000773A359|nr:3' terminal RNA ribose 2'-O-methyltransferase Hen1 [Herbidospora cretacea]
MLLTISTTRAPATDLGFLLHKHPGRVQEFPRAFGVAHVFYPEATDERCTAALLLEVDAVRLARTRGKATPEFSLGQYVNDRPYAASSLLSTAMADVFRTARSGRCNARPELAETAIPLEITLPALPCRGGPGLARRLFEPMGWDVTAEPIPLDPAFPEWGESRYVTLTLKGEQRLADALNHLYVLLPVLDDAKHYWIAEDEVDKLIRAGEGWLAAHPDLTLITKRFLNRRTALTRAAFARLAEVGDDDEETLEPPAEEEVRVPLNTLRRDAVTAAVGELGARTVIDLGCGSGQLILALLDEGVQKITGVDVSAHTLMIAARRLKLDRMGSRTRERVELFQGSVTYTDARFAGYDAAVLMEVVEHLDPPRLPAMERVVFGTAQPRHVLVTTPNAEYNPRYENLTGLRHPDHRFEWTRAEFRAWADGVAGRYGYDVEFRPVGDDDPEVGPPTQMAVFTKETQA